MTEAWDITIDTPVGRQRSTVYFEIYGEQLAGHQVTAEGEDVAVENGTLVDTSISWTIQLKKPFAITISFDGTVAHETLEGTAVAGPFPPASFVGVRPGENTEGSATDTAAGYESTVTQADFVSDPYTVLSRLRSESPVAELSSLGFWMLTRYDDVRDALQAPDKYASSAIPGLPDFFAGEAILTTDGPKHDQYRTSITPVLAPRAVERHVVDFLGTIVDAHIDAIEARGHADLMHDFFEPVSIAAFAELFGVPGVGPETLRRWFDGLVATIQNFARDPEIDARGRVISEEIDATLLKYAKGLTDSDEGLVAHLLKDAPGATVEERFADVIRTLKIVIGAGEQEPGHAGVNVLAGLLTHPEALEQFRNDPAGLAAAATEEGLRWIPSIQFLVRIPPEDIEIRGHTIPAGSVVALSLASANRDEEAWGENSHEFRLDRPRKQHLAFGFGSHFCAGNYFGRAVIKVALQRLFERLPELRLDPAAQLSFTGFNFRYPEGLACVWRAGNDNAPDPSHAGALPAVAISDAPEVGAALQHFAHSWRSGDPERVLATFSDDPLVVMGGGPGGALRGKEAIGEFLHTVVPLSAPADGGKVHFHKVDSYRAGDWGWCHAEGRLSLPGIAELDWNADGVCRLENAEWRWTMLNAGPPGKMPTG